MRQPLQTLMEKDVTRKEFIILFSLAIGAMFGLSRIIELLTGHNLHQNLNRKLGAKNIYGN